jgi:hypothetical protein
MSNRTIRIAYNPFMSDHKVHYRADFNTEEEAAKQIEFVARREHGDNWKLVLYRYTIEISITPFPNADALSREQARAALRYISDDTIPF